MVLRGIREHDKERCSTAWQGLCSKAERGVDF